MASRHGESLTTIELLEAIAKSEPSSPMAFSRSVHNATVGLFSIASQNTKPNTAIAAMENTFAMGLESQHIGAGLSDGEFGLQLRYEVTRKFAPYLDLRYEATFGETADMVRDAGESRDEWIAAVGLRLMF